MRLATIASGSSGNSTYIGSDNTHILVDAGISCKRISEGLNELDIDPRELNGIFITHEHSDHIQGLKVFTKKYNIPVYATPATIGRIKGDGLVNPELCKVIRADEDMMINDLVVHAFRNTHDAVEPVGYRISYGDKRVAVATDLGNFSAYTVKNLLGLDAIVLEANHDIRMLETGSYPYQLKRRILSDYGHLCNERSGQLLSEILHDNMKNIVLGHLSQENNLPELALLAVKAEVDNSDNKYHAKDFDICVADRNNLGRIINL